MTGPLRIETVTRATAREAAATLADAFADDPVMAYLVPRGNHRRRRRGFYLGEILAALGPGAVVKRPVVIDDEDLGETIAVRHMCYLALTYDHRLVDGADAGRFLQEVKSRLEAAQFEV